MRIKITSRLYLTGLTLPVRQAIENRLTFDNPAFAEAERMGRWTGKIPEKLTYFERTLGGDLIVPRGFIRQAINLARKYGQRTEIIDQRRTLPPADFAFSGTLKPFQEDAVEAARRREFGTLVAPTGSGKTVMALALVAARRQPTLIVVHTRDLAFQWIERIGTFLGIGEDAVGLIGAGANRMGEGITVALVQSLYPRAFSVSPSIGFLVVDECHRCPSRTFIKAVNQFDSRYMLGLSATPWRRDKLSRLIFWHLGDVVHEVDRAPLIESGSLVSAKAEFIPTNFFPTADPANEYPRVLSELTQDPQRNLLIAKNIASATANETKGGISLVLSDRKAHCEALRRILKKDFDFDAVGVLTGDTPSEERKRIVENLTLGRIRVLVATGQLVGEGFDCPELSSLFLATPIKFSGRVIQYLGRVLRPAPGKRGARIFDFVDEEVGVLRASASSRGAVYEQLGIQ